MSAFADDHAENMKNPEYAYEYGRAERELEIVALIEKTHEHGMTHSERCAIRHDFAEYLVERIKGETNE